ncbi:hypothetical protein [Humisphaera borealis]|uniref:Uncharacterized protein n=1 Tax=Humisphaera borealis TaxID=2807512 RepID=A0A7M2X277_9BACT|nr:hypothetical protein [Humisphaera borealis]QOV91823.1 hypothetical protein IPV69_10905 [Humisphaera borealis]
MAFGLQRMNWTRLVAVACVAGSLVAGLVHHADAAPKPGLVKAKGGYVFQGQVDEEAIPGKVVITQANGQKVELFKQAVDSIAYFNSPKEEFEARLANLGRQDVPGRIALARWALSKNEPLLAAEAVKAGRAIDANNAELIALEKQVGALMPKVEVKPEVVPATKPATKPVEAVAGPAIRTLTADEVQSVRLREIKQGEKLRVQISPALRKQVIDAGLVPANQISKVQPPELASLILSQGTPAMISELKLLADPVALNEYKMKVNKIIVSGCAASSCHGAADSKTLRLFTTNEEEAVLSNFVILQRTDRTIDGVRRLMIDRANPANSALLGFMLPASISRVPHPEVPGFKPAVKTANDAGFVATRDWLTNGLNVIAPSYEDINLSQPPPAKPEVKPEVKPAPGK